MKTHSTGALKPEARARQDALYASGPSYDVVIVGTGTAALAAGALFAKAGRRVCMLEAHDIPGGYVHSFRMGQFWFCAQIHYIWGCGRGDKVWQFLHHLGLNDDIRFEPLDPDQEVRPDVEGERSHAPACHPSADLTFPFEDLDLDVGLLQFPGAG